MGAKRSVIVGRNRENVWDRNDTITTFPVGAQNPQTVRMLGYLTF